MVLRSCRIVLEWVVGLVVGLALIAGLGLFWLSREPLPVDFAAPYIEAALSREGDMEVEVGEIQLVWAGWGSRIEVAARDWRVLGPGGERMLTVPRASIELSLSALLKGQVAPTAITLRDLHISLLREADGRFAFGEATPAEEGETTEDAPTAGSSALEFLFSELGNRPDADDPFAQLSTVTVAEASAVLVDRYLDVVWRAPHVDLRLLRDSSGVSAAGSAEVALGQQRSRFDLTMTKLASRPGLEAVVRFESLEPSAFAEIFPELEELRGLSGALNGRIGATIDAEGRPSDATLQLSSASLTVELPERLEQPLLVSNLALQAHRDGAGRPFVVERLEADLSPAAGGPGPHLVAATILQPIESANRFKLMAEITNVPAGDLRLYWPKGVGGNGRGWVIENVTGGQVDSATMSGSIRLEEGLDGVQEVESFGGRLYYRDLEIHYLRPMPPLTGLTGSAAYDTDGLDFTVEEGHERNIEIRNATASVYGLEGTDHRISMAFDGAGPLRDALTLLDHERLSLLDELGLDPAETSGSFTSRVDFAFPLVDDLTFDQVQVGVRSNLSDVVLKKGVAGYDLEDGTFNLALDAKGMKAAGTAKVAGIPLDATWSESFEAVERPTQVSATVPSVTLAELAAFGLDAGEYADGPLSLQLDIAADHRGNSRIGIAANLAELRAQVPQLAWSKPQGQPGTLQAVVTIDDDQLTAISDLSVETGSDRARGEILFAPEGGIGQATFGELALGRSSVSGLTVAPFQGDGYAISLGSGVLDAGPLLEEEEPRPGEDEVEGQGGESGEQETSDPPYLPLRIEIPSLSALYLGEGRSLEGVSLELVRDRAGWQLIKGQARIPRSLWRHKNRPVPEDAAVAEKTVSIFYRPQDAGYRFELFADDIGATMRAFDVIDSIEGGSAEIVGNLEAPLPDAPLEGRLETKGFRLVEAPAMAKLLTVASLTGIGNLLSGEGIQFDRAVGQFSLQDDILSTPLFRAYGSSLGITAKGQIDLEGQQTDLGGTLVPAYSVNRILGEIPILGDILTGGEGEGILGVTYRVSGHIADPNVSVNPLSILAPGFLRGLFSLGGGSDDAPPELHEAFPDGDGHR